ncbi:MAG: methyltransferase [Lachnospiraceae bacterium]
MISKNWTNIILGNELRTSLSGLRAELKDEEQRLEFLQDLKESEIEVLISMLKLEDAKTRKNAALLIGDLQLQAAKDILFERYNRENTRFIRADYLIALDKLGAKEYVPQLRQKYEQLVKYDPEETEQKHVTEELRALERILSKNETERNHTFIGFDQRHLILLTTIPGHQDITLSQIQAQKKSSNTIGVTAVVDGLKSVLKIRTFRELLFPIRFSTAHYITDSEEMIGKAILESNLLSLIKNCHKEEGPYSFRLEVRSRLDLTDRSRFSKKLGILLEEMSGRELINSTGNYEFEIRILADRDGKIAVLLKMMTIPMERFSYRKNSIAASIHPSSAALIMELAKPYLREQSNIIDPFCGVGTMLAERFFNTKASDMYGIDVFGDAIELGRENMEIAGLNVNFINRNFFEFKHSHHFDEIVTNMPVRGRKSKEELDAFYQNFFEKAREILKPGGNVILFSNEEGFIKKQLRLNRDFILRKEYEIFKKDHHNLYIIGLK